MKNTKGKVVIYVKQYCPFCKKAKELLNEKGVKYEEIDVLKNSDLFDLTVSNQNITSEQFHKFLLLMKNGDYVHHIAGCDKLMIVAEEGKLDDMLNNNEDRIDTTAYTSSSDEHDDLV